MSSDLTFITLSEAKTILNITDEEDDTQLTRLLQATTKQIQNYCDRQFFYEEDQIEYIDGDGESEEIFLKEYPIVSVDTLTIDDVEVLERVSLTEDGFIIYAEEGYIYYAGGFSKGRKNIYVKYSAGYEDIPDDVMLAAKNLLSHYWNIPEVGDIESEKTPAGYQITYRRSAIEKEGIPADIKGLLNPYKRTVIA